MKKYLWPGIIGVVILALLGFFCCKEPAPIEKSLKETFRGLAKSKGIKYKYSDYNVVDTVFIQDIIDSLEAQVAHVAIEPDKDKFMELRNQEFKVFRAKEPDYEMKLMSGELADSIDGSWNKTLRSYIVSADSLLDVWDEVDRYNPDFLWLYYFFVNRKAKYYGVNMDINILKSFIAVKPKLEYLQQLRAFNPNSIHHFVVEHKYKLYSEALDRYIDFNKTVEIDKDYNVVSIYD